MIVLSRYRYHKLLVCVTCFLLGCSGENPGTVYETRYTLDLDNLTVTDIEIRDEHRIILFGEDDLMSYPYYITVAGQLIFLNDRRATPLRIIDKETYEVIRSYANGRGPGEFGLISGISANSRHVVVAEKSNSRKTYFNYMGGIDSMAVTSIPYLSDFTSVFSMNDSLYTSDTSHPEYLIQLNNLYRVKEPVFLKERVIPLGYQPRVYNWPLITISDQYLAFSIAGIPDITFADLYGREMFSIAVSSKEINKIENPPVEPKQSVAIGVRAVFTVLKVIRDRLIIVTTGGILNIIEIDFEDPAHSRIVGRFRFMEPDEIGQLEILNINDLDYDGKDLYFTAQNSGTIYLIPL